MPFTMHIILLSLKNMIHKTMTIKSAKVISWMAPRPPKGNTIRFENFYNLFENFCIPIQILTYLAVYVLYTDHFCNLLLFLFYPLFKILFGEFVGPMLQSLSHYW